MAQCGKGVTGKLAHGTKGESWSGLDEQGCRRRRGRGRGQPEQWSSGSTAAGEVSASHRLASDAVRRPDTSLTVAVDTHDGHWTTSPSVELLNRTAVCSIVIV